eukprot:CAMPEP_0179099440 /NCGR_PEP_ID=MMETSP0796-20121207/45875_1 /TAXON_ID=73915 /ORGANISM="Pyrodinium bahamense, Strain pbaha01" /LENGTH=253 /DNA_ID=CAMNT_0020797239 /DNA_START=40 /DNA_END=801 /DNA_ORIENTATION=+
MAAAVAMPVSPRAFDFKSPAPAADRLEEAFAAVHMRTAQWRKDSARAAQQELQHGVEELRRERAGLEALCTGLAGTEQLTEAARRVKAEGSRLAEAMRRSADAVAQRAEAALGARDQLREVQGLRHKELRCEEEALAEQRRLAEVQEAAIEGFLGLYRERLGLAVSRAAPRTVRLAFTLLDEADPAREFSLTLSIAEPQGYCVLECCPQVPQVATLLEHLNCNADSPAALPTFVCGMRRAFRHVAGAAGGRWP